MSTCAQNQSNQEEEGGANNDQNETSAPGSGNHDAVQHFLATSQAQAAANGATSRSNGLPAHAARGIQVHFSFLIVNFLKLNASLL